MPSSMIFLFRWINSIYSIKSAILSFKQRATVSNENLCNSLTAEKSSARRLNIQNQFRIFYSPAANSLAVSNAFTLPNAIDTISCENDYSSRHRRKAGTARPFGKSSLPLSYHSCSKLVRLCFPLTETWWEIQRRGPGHVYTSSWLKVFLILATAHLPTALRATSALNSRVFVICSRLWHHLFEEHEIYTTRRAARCKRLKRNRHDLFNLLSHWRLQSEIYSLMAD